MASLATQGGVSDTSSVPPFSSLPSPGAHSTQSPLTQPYDSGSSKSVDSTAPGQALSTLVYMEPPPCSPCLQSILATVYPAEGLRGFIHIPALLRNYVLLHWAYPSNPNIPRLSHSVLLFQNPREEHFKKSVTWVREHREAM